MDARELFLLAKLLRRLIVSDRYQGEKSWVSPDPSLFVFNLSAQERATLAHLLHKVASYGESARERQLKTNGRR